MKKISREIVHIISRHSSLNENQLEELLDEHVRPEKQEWIQFLKLVFLILGLGFVTAGIIFFFAYNWEALGKFTRMGIAEGLLLLSLLPVFVPSLSDFVKKSVLTGSSVLVGVLFAVFGQEYQTGANAFDFFLAWTIFITIWTLVANFSLFWLIYLVLFQLTYGLYLLQVKPDWGIINAFTSFYAFNAVVIIVFHAVKSKFSSVQFAWWLEVMLGIIGIGSATIGVAFGIHYKEDGQLLTLILAVIVGYTLAVWFAYYMRKLFYISLICLSVMAMLSSLLLKISHNEGMFLFVSLFIVAGVTLTIYYLLQTHKKWSNDKQ